MSATLTLFLDAGGDTAVGNALIRRIGARFNEILGAGQHQAFFAQYKDYR